MKVSQIGLIDKKLTELDEQFPVQDMLVQTGQIDQFSSGIYAYGHVPYLVKKNVDKVISSVLSKYNCAEISLPILQPESIWIESGRLERYVSDGVMFRSLNDNGNYCLAPTAEEAVVSFAKRRLFSYKQLPVTYFQIGAKFRNELRSRGFLLRGKAFDMMDAYSFDRSQEDLDKSYDNMKKAYLDIFNELGLKVQPVGADSGAIGGSKSEEFMMISPIGEDNILVDPKTNKAFNTELLDRDDAEAYLLENYGIKDINNLEKKKAVELGHIFQLGDKYSKSMNATYIDEDNSYKNFVMGCYGIGVSRTVAMVYENGIVLKDGKFDGIALPVNISPYTIYLIPKNDDPDKLKIANDIYQELEDKKIPVLFDDRDNMSIGAKIKDSKVVGTPYCAVLGKTLDDGIITIENNKTGEKLDVKLEEFVSLLSLFEKERYNNKTIEELK